MASRFRSYFDKLVGTFKPSIIDRESTPILGNLIIGNTMDENLKLVSAKCLFGRPVPRSLKILWQAHEEKDPFLADALWLTLLTSLDVLDDGYAEGIADGSPDILANVRAHRRVFERLGFFAQGDDSELYAFDFQSGIADDPPVAVLDTEGQYEWKGENLAEVIFRIAEDRDQGDEARKWLAAQSLPLGDLGELGSTTQFLPSLKDYQERIYYQNLGQPREEKPTPTRSADHSDPFTWLLRPAAEVRAALCALLKLPAGATPSMFCVWCDGAGRVTNVKVPRTPATEQTPIHGVKFGSTEAEVANLLGKPTETGKKMNWSAYKLDLGRIRLSFEDGKVDEISVGLNK